MVQAAFALVADAFEDRQIFFTDRALPHGGLDAVEEFEDFGFAERRIGMAFGHGVGNFRSGARAVAKLEEFVFGDAVTIVGIGLVVLDDVAGFAGDDLFADAQIGAQFGAAQAFGEDAGDLQAGGPKTHSMCPSGARIDYDKQNQYARFVRKPRDEAGATKATVKTKEPAGRRRYEVNGKGWRSEDRRYKSRGNNNGNCKTWAGRHGCGGGLEFRFDGGVGCATATDEGRAAVPGQITRTAMPGRRSEGCRSC